MTTTPGRTRIRSRLAASVVGAIVVVLVSPSLVPAQAAPEPAPKPAPKSPPGAKSEQTPPRIRGTNWAGYVVTGSFKSVSAEWVEPEVTCSDTGVIQRVVPWVGLNGTQVNGKQALPLMQTGSEAICVSPAGALASLPGLAVVNLASATVADNPAWFRNAVRAAQSMNSQIGQAASDGCALLGTGSAQGAAMCAQQTYRMALWEAYPANPVIYPDVSSNPGDTMRASVSFDGKAYTMTLANVTQNWTRTTVAESDAPALSAEIIVEGQLNSALPTFSPITFTNVQIDGKPLTAFEPVGYSIGATNGELGPGPINESGTGFTIAK
ncbi:G1 family glutamic endopeptidase [Nocardia sp. XZ_19_369]|uniref:G1 family glutamic endopeptidase n=1 Tax=Nocardia sp. XZ_19_369 TaxID=2769487 RepID=UPI001890A885|nr:G1 family glutamic endopeptidase [Nocardia sp. XZ_19_369]